MSSLVAIAFALSLESHATDRAAEGRAPATVGVGQVTAASLLAGPLSPSVAHLTPGKQGGADVTLFNVNTREQLSLYLRFDGLTDEATSKQLARFFRCKRSGRKRRIDAGVLGLFAQLGAHYPGRTIEVVSGVRAPGYGVRDSKHYTGHAIDFRVRGVPTREVRDLAWSLGDENGVGFYRGENFLHLDHRPGESKIAWEQRRPGTPNRYHPRWAKRPRTSLRSAEPRW